MEYVPSRTVFWFLNLLLASGWCRFLHKPGGGDPYRTAMSLFDTATGFRSETKTETAVHQSRPLRVILGLSGSADKPSWNPAHPG